MAKTLHEAWGNSFKGEIAQMVKFQTAQCIFCLAKNGIPMNWRSLCSIVPLPSKSYESYGLPRPFKTAQFSGSAGFLHLSCAAKVQGRGSLLIFLFGSFFGLAAGKTLGDPEMDWLNRSQRNTVGAPVVPLGLRDLAARVGCIVVLLLTDWMCFCASTIPL